MIVPITDIEIKNGINEFVEGKCQLNNGAYIRYELRRIKKKKNCAYSLRFSEDIRETLNVFNIEIDWKFIINHAEKEFFKETHKSLKIMEEDHNLIEACC